MTRALIIGSGLASAGAALALSRYPGIDIQILDIGLQLEPDRQAAVETLSSSYPSAWDDRLVGRVSTRPIRSESGGLPQKRAYGSDFPFRDVGQLEGLVTSKGIGRTLISPAYGGFSTVWGAQIMPFTAASLENWPVSLSEMTPHYEAVLARIPYAGVEDDLASLFPLMGSPRPLPQLSPRTSRVLDAYGRQRRHLNAMGITMGHARLALSSTSCIRTGLCMTGCPYSLIFSASQTIDELRRDRSVTYHAGLLAIRLLEGNEIATVLAKDLSTGNIHRFEADRVFVACGAIGTTRLVAGSLELWNRTIPMAESQQFTIPMMSRHAVADPRFEAKFTLNQFNMALDLDASGGRVSQLHFYPYDPAFIDALPSPIRARAAQRVMLQLLRRLTIGIGYLPSSDSPRLQLRIAPATDDALPRLEVGRDDPDWIRNTTLRDVLIRLLRASRRLDLYPVVPKLMLAAGGKSYHWGSSFPHSAAAKDTLSSDRFGRVGGWKRIHLVDGSVFPDVPATTYGLTVMANAHRIASEAMELPR